MTGECSDGDDETDIDAIQVVAAVVLLVAWRGVRFDVCVAFFHLPADIGAALAVVANTGDIVGVIVGRVGEGEGEDRGEDVRVVVVVVDDDDGCAVDRLF